MKRILALLLMLSVLVSLIACASSYTNVNLKEPMDISESEPVEKELLEQIKEENSIATFRGTSGGMSYEWKIFGSELTDVQDVNLLLTIEKIDGGIKLIFAEEQSLGFSALLSVFLDEKWNALSATAYHGDTPVCSVSVTSDASVSILTLSLNQLSDAYVILPDQEKQAVTDIDRPSSDGSVTDQDQYKTDPVPEGKPLPVEPENQEVNKGKTYTCTFSIECSTILNNLSELDPDKLELVPTNGVILAPTTVTFYEGESVFDVLQRVCKENNIHLESSWTPIYNSAYIEGIHNLYEFDCGALSGWMYRVNGWYPNYGCSRYQLADGEVVEWRFTCDLGEDVGRDGSW